MKYNRYLAVVIIRVILITLNSFALIWFVTQINRPATTLLILALLFYQTGGLIFYLNRINRDLNHFFEFLLENDTTIGFVKKKIEKNFRGISGKLDIISQKLQNAGIEKERQFQYLQALVKQIDTGIIACDQEGKIELINHTAKDMLGIPSVQHTDEIAGLRPELVPVLSGHGDLNTGFPVKIRAKGKERILSVKTGAIKYENKQIRLISLHNITSEMEAGELDAWRRLIRIQRHEIINSITPITTLTTAIKRRLKKGKVIKKPGEITDEQIEDALNSIEVIEERSRGLIDFMERFRNLTDVPLLKKETFKLKKLIEAIGLLYSKDLDSKNISLKIKIVPDNLALQADEKLLEQVMINLLKNSLEAIQNGEGEITITAYRNPLNQTVIQVVDNGIGIEKNAMENIFIPAFSTKEKGSGIGLSIIRQIVRLHNGTIQVRSEPGVRTVFEITLPE